MRNVSQLAEDPHMAKISKRVALPQVTPRPRWALHLTAHEAGQAGQSITDAVVLAFATAAGRAVVTFNRRHFVRLHAEVSSHAGIMVCTRDDDVLALADRIHQQLQSVPILQDQLLRINRPAKA